MELKNWAPNTIPMLIMEFLTIIMVIIGINYLIPELLNLRRRD
jgi:hypothetical protein